MDGRQGVPCVVVLAGSPRAHGACAALASQVAEGVRAAGADTRLLHLGDYDVAGCTGCGACERTGECVLDARELRAARDGGRPGLSALVRELEVADALVLVAPVYFAGPPSQLKALFDRLQPYWAQRYLLQTRPQARPHDQRRPFDLVVAGTGKDPFGYDPLVTCARSALRMLDFELANVRSAVALDPHDPQVVAQARAWGEDLGTRALR